MSRLRVPFRKQSSSAPTPTLEPVPEPIVEPESPATIVVEKGKEHEVERLWGLENFGNTCYCNSVLQALYACEPFRKFVQSYPDAPAPITPLAPAPGETMKTPSSPLTTKSNPFDNPVLNNNASPSPADKKRGLFARRPTNTNFPILPPKETPSFPPILVSSQDVPPVPPNPDAPPPTVFETIQTLFNHLSASLPHQPLPARKDAKANAETAQTASLLPAEMANGPPSPTAPVNPIPQGPPLLASLPPPSAPRGGGPFQAGTLGRGVVRPEDLLKTVKRENEMFRGMSQQDAHEFLGWVLNKVAEDIDVVDRSLRDVGKEVSKIRGHGKTFIQNLFEGILTNETRCLSCETTSSRDELFLDLSIDIEQHSSVTACLRQFSASEMLCQKNKFFCDSCCGLQEAEKRMKIKRLPHVLALHLKRFKYQETLGRYTKLFYRVPFPTQLRLPNTSDDTEDPDRLYELFAVVVHIGNGPHHGHYVCLIRSGGRWVMCDDENIEPIDDSDIYRYFGDYPSGAGYVLFYQAVDLDLPSLGLKVPPAKAKPTPEAKPTPAPATTLVDIPETHEKSAPLSSPDIPATASSPIAPKVAPHPSPAPVPETAPRVTPVPQPTSPSPAAPIEFIQPRRTMSTLSTSPNALATAMNPSPGNATPASPQAVRPPTPVLTSPSITSVTPVAPVAPVTLAAPVAPTPAPVAAEPVAVSRSPAELVPASAASPGPVANQAPVSPSPIPVNGAKRDEKWYRRKSSTSREAPLPAEPTNTSARPDTSAQSQLGASLGRKPSSSRDRTVSNSSQTSNTAANDKYSGGGGLSRRLSGMSVSKIGRSGSMSFGKLGFGKKDKNGIAE